jgi:hypothetical protein
VNADDELMQTLRSVYSRGFAPEVHTLFLTFIGGALGFGLASAVLGPVSGSWSGALAAALFLTATGFVVDFGIRVSHPRGSMPWFVASLLWFAIGVPIAANLAPGYSLHGFETTVTVIVIVWICDVSVSRASPWRTRWQAEL